MPLTKNQRIPLTITGMTAEGNGVGRYEEEGPGGIAVFVPFTAVGDRLRCHIVKVEKKLAFGRVEGLEEASPDRLEGEADCPAFGRCGGCAFRHITYEAELRYKWQRVADALRRIGGFSLEPRPILGCVSPERYRNKAQYPVAQGDHRLFAGFYAPRSHRIIEQRDCRLQPELFRAALDAVLQWAKRAGVAGYDEAAGTGLLRHVYIRQAEATGEVMVCLVCTSGKLPQAKGLIAALREAVPGLASLVVNVNRRATNVILGPDTFTLWGKDAITDELCGLRFRLSPQSFYQVNRRQAEELYRLAGEEAGLTGKETLLDLYCGTGTIGLTMADKAAMVIGVEAVAPAVEDARRNAEENGILNARFLCADAAEAAARLEEEGIRPDVVVLDPPRKGCAEAVLETVARMRPERVVYVSCDPATLARDLRRLEGRGYTVQSVTPVDMFPRTAHVETVVLLSKLNTKQHIEVELNLDELDLTSAESKATYDEIKAYVLEKYGLKVSSLYISQVKRKCGLDVGQNYNLSKKEDTKVPQCPPEKEAAIMEALKYFRMS